MAAVKKNKGAKRSARDGSDYVPTPAMQEARRRIVEESGVEVPRELVEALLKRHGVTR